MASKISPSVEKALERLRCNSWRYNPNAKAYERVDDDAYAVEECIRRLTSEIEDANEKLSSTRIEVQKWLTIAESYQTKAEFSEWKEISDLRARVEAQSKRMEFMTEERIKTQEAANDSDRMFRVQVVNLQRQIQKLKDELFHYETEEEIAEVLK